MNDSVLTVLCTTYNQKDYIKNALDGILSQETTFPFDVVVHDDASTDGTSDIVRDYAKIDNRIHAIIEDKNLYSQNKSYYYDDFLPSLRSKYLARCEGDDYWCDTRKLQMQIEHLEEHDDCVACVHNSLVVDLNRHTRCKLSNHKGDRDLPISCLVGNAVPFQTSSIVLRASLYSSYPAFLRSVPGIGDYPLRVYLALCGRVHYFDRVMSVYRRGVSGSWTQLRTIDANDRIEDYTNIINMLQMADNYSDYLYHDIIYNAIKEQEYNILDSQAKYTELLTQPYRNIFLYKRSLKHKIRILLSVISQLRHYS